MPNTYDNNNKPVDILVGLDYFYNFITRKTIKGVPNTLVVLDSNLGFILCGQSRINSTKQDASNMTNFVTSHTLKIEFEVINSANGDMTLIDHLNHFWEMEILGIESNSVYETFKNETYFDGQNYITSLTFKPHHKPISDNFMLSKHRLHSLKNKLDRDPDLKGEYHEILQDYIKKGIIEKVNDEGIPRKTHYLPHRTAVRHDEETSKVRIVFDDSAKVDQYTSLNKALYSGLSLLCMIFDILLRFRLHKYILLSDIKRALLNVAVGVEDSDFLRFLWFEDPFANDEKVTAFRFLRVVFGLICSPSLLNATIKVQCEKYLNV